MGLRGAWGGVLEQRTALSEDAVVLPSAGSVPVWRVKRRGQEQERRTHGEKTLPQAYLQHM